MSTRDARSTVTTSPRSRGVVAVCAIALATLFVSMGLSTTARADTPEYKGSLNETPPELSTVDIVEHLGGPLPMDAVFRDSNGEMVRLGSFFDGKRPVAIVFAYHSCPMLCTLVLDGFARGVKGVPWTVGKEYDVLAISIDPRDTPASATKKRAQIVEQYDRAGSLGGWHFLVGDETNIRRVTNAVGFQFHYDERQQQYAHPAAMYLATPDGNLARYLYGIEFAPNDIRLGLFEASQGRSISTVEKLIMYCYHYDPAGKRYSLVAMNVMRVGGGITAVLLGGLLAILWMRERRRSRSRIDATDSKLPLSASPSADRDATESPRTTSAPPRPATHHAP